MSSDSVDNPRRLVKRGLLERNGPFAVALGASLAFHLMMVTVFAIEIRFPIEYMDYYPIYLMAQAPVATVPQTTVAEQSPGALLRKPSADTLVETALASDDTSRAQEGAAALSSLLPTIEMPRLQLSSASPAPAPGGSLQIRSEFTYLLEEKRPDSWARFTGEMQGLGSAFSKLTFGRFIGGETAGDKEEDKPVRVGMPAPGIGLYVKWMAKPKDRRLMFAPPNRALWGLDAGQVPVPVTVLFSVDPEGKVVDVERPVEDDAGIAVSVAEALAKYRFEPSKDSRNPVHHGVLIVAAEPANP